MNISKTKDKKSFHFFNDGQTFRNLGAIKTFIEGKNDCCRSQVILLRNDESNHSYLGIN